MRVLVIGGSHLIGYYLLPLLVQNGHHVTVVTRGNRPLSSMRVTHVVGDRHTVSLSGSFDVAIDTLAYNWPEAEALLNSLNGRLGRYLVISTAFVYVGLEDGFNAPSAPITENHPAWHEASWTNAEPFSHLAYVRGKQRLEHFLHAPHGIPITVIRPLLQIVEPNTEDGRFAWFWRRVTDRGPIWLPDDAREKAGPCQLAFSGDIARTIASLMEKPQGDLVQVYNAGSPSYGPMRNIFVLWLTAVPSRSVTLPALRWMRGPAASIAFRSRIPSRSMFNVFLIRQTSGRLP